MAQHTDQEWFKEFGAEYQLPDEVLALLDSGALRDTSWHHDVYPSVVPAAPHAPDGLRLWIAPADPTLRETGADTPRYSVCVCDDVRYVGDDVHEALAALQATVPAIPADAAHYVNTVTGGPACDAATIVHGTVYRALVTCPACLALIEAPTQAEVAAAVAADTCVNCGELYWTVTSADGRPRSAAAYVQDGHCIDCADDGDSDDDGEPNGCAECARSFGPHYTGRCAH